MTRSGLHKIAVVLIVFIASGVASGASSSLIRFTQPQSLGHRGVTWDVVLAISDAEGCFDTVTFGEAVGAHDGPPADMYDVAKPPSPPGTPYLRAWFNDNLQPPYNLLFADYRSNTTHTKTWNLSVKHVVEGVLGTVTITWNDDILGTEYVSVGLYTEGGVLLKDMLVYRSYSFSCPDDVLQKFKIVCTKNDPPFVPSDPFPADNAMNVPLTTILTWDGGDPESDPVTYDVYFGTVNNPGIVVHNQSGTSYDPPGELAVNTFYFWRIVAWDSPYHHRTSGVEWNFKTLDNQCPYPPSNPFPANGGYGVPITVDLSWTGSDPNDDPLTYDVYFGTTSPPPLIVHNQSGTTYDPGLLGLSTPYYWQIKAWDSVSGTMSLPWSFMTNQPPYIPYNPSPMNGATDVSIDVVLSWSGGDPDVGQPVTYDVYFGLTSPPPMVIGNQSGTSYNPPGNLTYSSKYYWKIVAWDNQSVPSSDGIWTFWTHHNEAPGAPFDPYPEDGAIEVACDSNVFWQCNDNDSDSLTFDVYFGTSPTPPCVSHNQSIMTYDPGLMPYETVHYWRIKAWDCHGNGTWGPYWWFRTRIVNHEPVKPFNPQPSDGEWDIVGSVTMSWSCNDPDSDPLRYDVFYGVDTLEKVSANQTANSYTVYNLLYNTTYHWQIVAWDNHNASNASDVWVFHTMNDSYNPYVRIDQPKEGYLYINILDIFKLRPIKWFSTWVIGRVDVMVTAEDNQSGIQKVEFYVDEKLMSTDSELPYLWKWTEHGLLFQSELKVVAYDYAGRTGSDDIKVMKFP